MSVTTTQYIGKHFEVRDHDQPTKYVFNGATRVAEITGSLSTNPRIQRLRLVPGWNLCSVAVTGLFPAGGAEPIAMAYAWNSGTANYSEISLGQRVLAGTVLWVKANTNAMISVLGAYTHPMPWSVPPGGTYLAGAGLEVWSPDLPSSDATWSFDGSIAQWTDHLWDGLASASGPSPTVAPGEALYVRAVSPGALEPPDPTLRIRYYHQDHLGSSSAITDAQGNLVEETGFYPFGVPRDQEVPRQVHDPYQFTQKERDRESGLQYFEARYVESALARFITVDTKYANADRLSQADLTAFLTSPQQMNLYAYVQSNPLKQIDPTGLGPMDYMIPKTKEEYERDLKAAEEAFALPGKVWDAITGKYHDIRNKYCFWPVEGCKVDWKGTYRRWFNWGSDDDDDKPKPQPAPVPSPQRGSGHGSAGEGPPGNPTETQRKVLSVIASLLSDLNDVVSDNPSNTKPPAHSTAPPHSSSRAPSSPSQPRKYLKVDLEDMHVSGYHDATSP